VHFSRHTATVDMAGPQPEPTLLDMALDDKLSLPPQPGPTLLDMALDDRWSFTPQVAQPTPNPQSRPVSGGNLPQYVTNWIYHGLRYLKTTIVNFDVRSVADSIFKLTEMFINRSEVVHGIQNNVSNRPEHQIFGGFIDNQPTDVDYLMIASFENEKQPGKIISFPFAIAKIKGYDTLKIAPEYQNSLRGRIHNLQSIKAVDVQRVKGKVLVEKMDDCVCGPDGRELFPNAKPLVSLASKSRSFPGCVESKIADFVDFELVTISLIIVFIS
jgi:hypothetical protein